MEYVTSPAGSLASERAANGRKDPWKLPYIGLGNELWGCGGNMRAEYAADVTRRYSTFIKVPAGVQILKSASGPSDEDYHWMEVMMRDAGRHFDAIGLHYYTITGTWAKKGSATDVRRSRIRQDSPGHAPHGRHHCASRRHHGQVRSQQARLARRRRMGHLVRHRARAPTPASSTSRTPCATRWSPPSTSTSSSSTPTASKWPTSPR